MHIRSQSPQRRLTPIIGINRRYGRIAEFVAAFISQRPLAHGAS
jgi:hypothetical protein